MGGKRSFEGKGVKQKRYEKLNKTLDDLFGPYEEGKCRVCREEVGKYDSNRRHYCSDRCWRIAKAVQRKFTWDVVRAKVMRRDDYECQRCGKDRGANSYNGLHVHHIVPLSKGGHPFDEENLITLCPSCHGEMESPSGTEKRARPHVPLDEFLPGKKGEEDG